MAFQRYINGFDQCNPPTCPTNDISVVISSWNCSNDNLYVEWVIEDTYNTSFPDLPYNKLLWSCNDSSSFSNSVNSPSLIEPYSATVDVSGCDGIVYFKARVKIDNDFFESDIKNQSTFLCEELGDEKVRAQLCQTCNPPQTPPAYDLYVNEAAVAVALPAYFKYDDLCWYVDRSAYDDRTPISAGDFVLASLPNSHATCESCCLGLECPSDWQGLTPNSWGLFLIEYTTYSARDQIRVWANYVPEFCLGSEIIWTSGCVGTARTLRSGKADCHNHPCQGVPPAHPDYRSLYGEGIGKYVSGDELLATDWTHSQSNVKQACFGVAEDQLPIGISIDANCHSGDPTVWCATVFGPNNFHATFCGGSNDLCSPMVSDIHEIYTFSFTPEDEPELEKTYNLIKPQLAGLTNSEKEVFLIKMVGDGKLTAYEAIYIGTEEKLDFLN